MTDARTQAEDALAQYDSVLKAIFEHGDLGWSAFDLRLIAEREAIPALRALLAEYDRLTTPSNEDAPRQLVIAAIEADRAQRATYTFDEETAAEAGAWKTGERLFGSDAGIYVAGYVDGWRGDRTRAGRD